MKKTKGAKAPAKTTRKRASKQAAKRVVFTLHAEKGKKVCLAGQFNDWNPTAKKLTYKTKDDVYSTILKLAPGTYEYKFVVDGVWCADPENADSVRNDQGTFNSVIVVK